MIALHNPHLILAYKNFAANVGVSHTGLGISAANNMKVLKKHGITTDVAAVTSAQELATRIKSDTTITHVVISAPWISSPDIANVLLRAFPRVEFVVNVHSNVGFLQADTRGVDLIREYTELEQANGNFRVAANSQKGVDWLQQAEQAPCLYLPNLYYLDYSVVPHRALWNGGTLRIGAFGAQRPLKNLMSAAGAALVIANTLKADVEFWMSGGRAEGGGDTVVRSVGAMLSGRPNITLKQSNWSSWPKFRDLVRNMHLLMSVSYTESFNMVTADGVAEGVPSVVSSAIDWAPRYWQVGVDETNDIARVGRQLIADPHAANDGLVALEKHNKSGFEHSWCPFTGLALQYKSLIPGV